MDMIAVFCIDPPWPKKKGGLRRVRPNQARGLDYPTMPVNEIFELLDQEIFPQAYNPHVVFLWTVDQFLWDAEWAMEQRAYHRHARLVWDKGNGVAPAFTVRYTHEYLLWYYKPTLLQVDLSIRGKLGTVIRGKGQEHSRKPDAAYDYIRQLYPTQICMDVFSRENREGWLAWGNEVGRFEKEEA